MRALYHPSVRRLEPPDVPRPVHLSPIHKKEITLKIPIIRSGKLPLIFVGENFGSFMSKLITLVKLQNNMCLFHHHYQNIIIPLGCNFDNNNRIKN